MITKSSMIWELRQENHHTVCSNILNLNYLIKEASFKSDIINLNFRMKLLKKRQVRFEFIETELTETIIRHIDDIFFMITIKHVSSQSIRVINWVINICCCTSSADSSSSYINHTCYSFFKILISKRKASSCLTTITFLWSLSNWLITFQKMHRILQSSETCSRMKKIDFDTTTTAEATRFWC